MPKMSNLFTRSLQNTRSLHDLRRQVPPRYPAKGPLNGRPRRKVAPPLNIVDAPTLSSSRSNSDDILDNVTPRCTANTALDSPTQSAVLPSATPGKAALEAALDALDNEKAKGASLPSKATTVFSPSVSHCTLVTSSSTSESLLSMRSSSSTEWTRRTTNSPANRHTDGKMRTAYVPSHGPPAVFRLGWVDRPTKKLLEPGQALVRIHAAGVNSADCKLRSGELRRLLPMPFPTVLGTDFAGTIVHVKHEVGSDSELKMGDSVYGQADLSTGFGAYAEWAVVSIRRIARMPENLSFTQAAALPTISLAAHAALMAYAKIRAGDRVLVFGGTSGVGHAALQLARALGASNVSTTCSARNASFCKKLGASNTYDYHEIAAEQIVKAAQPDIVLDTAGSPQHWAAVQTHAPGARFVVASGSECLGTLAFAAGVGYFDVLDGVARAAGRKAISRIRKGGYDLVMPCALDVPLETITPFVEHGHLLPSIFKEFALVDIAKAHMLRENKRPRGKVVINIVDEDIS